MKELFPALDLLAQNAVAAMLISIVLFLMTQFVVFEVLKVASRLMKLSIFEDVAGTEQERLEQRLRRSARRMVLMVTFGLMVGAVVASYLGHSALEVGQAALRWFQQQELATLQAGFLKCLGLVAAAAALDTVFRGVMALFSRTLAQSQRFTTHRELMMEVLNRSLSAGRTIIWAETLLLLGSTLQLPAGVQHVLLLIMCTLEAIAVSRAVSRLGYLVTDVGFGLADQLTRMDGPLRALSDLKNLTSITKRVSDYLVYVGAATWVAGHAGSQTWYYSAGQLGLRLIVIFYACRVLVEVSILLAQELMSGTEALSESDVQRRRTLLPVIRGFLRYGIYFTGLTMGLSEANIDPTPLLAGAGVIGVAIGFGAQTFVGDVVAGFFILLEDLLLVGDVVQIGEIEGTVEEIGVRITKIRDDFGVLHCIPNGEVRRVSNHSRDYVNAVVDVHVPYEEKLPQVVTLLEKLAPVFLKEKGVPQGTVEVKVQELTEATVLLRLVVQVPPGRDNDLGELLRARVVESLSKAGVGAPRPRKAVIIDTAFAVGAPAKAAEGEEEASGPVNPFSPAQD